MDTDASTMSVSHKTYPRRCVCARIYEFAMHKKDDRRIKHRTFEGRPILLSSVGFAVVAASSVAALAAPAAVEAFAVH